jgi:hypothetical protein
MYISYPPATDSMMMRLSTLQQWSLIIGACLLAFLALPVLAGIASPGDFMSLVTGQPRPESSPACTAMDYGGFYQDAVIAPEAVIRQEGGVTFTIRPLYRYRIAGRIVGKDEYFLSPLDRLAPMDLTIATGEILRPEIFSQFTFRKYSRHFSYQYVFPGGTPPLSPQYIASHVSNSHLIFANDAVHAAARDARVGDMVEIEGSLVTVSGTGSDGRTWTWRTSTTRADQGEGSCELVYVERFRQETC